MTDSFPRRHARTRRFTLGSPRGFTISPDGSRLVFLRSQGSADPVTCLWSLNVATGVERLVADPATLTADAGEVPAEERARRERSREQAEGIVGYACDRELTMVAFTLAGRLYLAPLPGADGENGADGAEPEPPRLLGTPPGVVDPRLDPPGYRLAFVHEGALWLYDLATNTSFALAEPEAEGVRYGLADFVAAEEMGRMRGFWWSPDGAAILTTRTDDSAVTRWHIADPANPERPPATVAYPAAGTPNVRTELVLLGRDGSRTAVDRDPDDEYLANVTWDDTDLLLTTAPRDQRSLRVLRVNPATGASTPVVRNTDPDWVDVVPGVPAHLSGGELVWTADSDNARRLHVGGEPVTPPTLQVRAVLDTDSDTVLFSASEEPTEIRVWSYHPLDGLSCLTPEPGVFGARRRGGTTVVTAQTLDTDAAAVTVHRADGTSLPVRSLAEPSGLEPRPRLLAVGPRRLRTAVLLPSWHRAGDRLPVLLDPYGGPHAQRVLAARGTFLTSQWFADQGFAVVVADGRGTPGRGPDFERAVAGDLAGPVLEDQLAALAGACEEFPELDTRMVAIRGWSFGGYLAALAVLRRPDVFHAAVAGAPVTDWRLYDTHYTERYLGDPERDPTAYQRSSLLDDAPSLTRPLLLVHGLADDNVVAAHTLRLSSALLAAGRAHSVLPLSGVTHMTPQEVVAENLLLMQVEFLRSALASLVTR